MNHHPLLHLKAIKLRAVEQHWVSQLMFFDFNLLHKMVLEHQNADMQMQGGVGRCTPLGRIIYCNTVSLNKPMGIEKYLPVCVRSLPRGSRT